MNYSKEAIKASQFSIIVQVIIGSVFVIISLVPMLLSFYSDSIFFVFIFLFFITIGASFIVEAIKTNNLLKKLSQYAKHLSIEPTGSIEGLAIAMNITQPLVIYYIELMMEKKFLVNVYIDKETNCLKSSVKIDEVELVTIICKHCGGENQMKIGQICECEYCGSLIQCEASKG